MPSRGSVSEWIFDLKAGDADALERIVRRYQSDLLAEARRRLRAVPSGGRLDESDLSQDVWINVWKSAQAGRLEYVTDREKLWPLLVVITNCKAVDLARRESAAKRGGQRVVNESALSGGVEQEGLTLDNLAGNRATPEFLAIVGEEYARLMSILRDDTLRAIAQSRFEGFQDAEIAERLSTSCRTVQRKLGLIRDCWKREADNAVNA